MWHGFTGSWCCEGLYFHSCFGVGGLSTNLHDYLFSIRLLIHQVCLSAFMFLLLLGFYRIPLSLQWLCNGFSRERVDLRWGIGEKLPDLFHGWLCFQYFWTHLSFYKRKLISYQCREGKSLLPRNKCACNVEFRKETWLQKLLCLQFDIFVNIR